MRINASKYETWYLDSNLHCFFGSRLGRGCQKFIVTSRVTQPNEKYTTAQGGDQWTLAIDQKMTGIQILSIITVQSMGMSQSVFLSFLKNKETTCDNRSDPWIR